MKLVQEIRLTSRCWHYESRLVHA